jgi:uncharacterized protein DUF1570
MAPSTAHWTACVLLTLSIRGAASQGGYETQGFPELGLKCAMARDYEQIPTQPDETWIVLHFAERVPKDPEQRKSIRPELRFLWIDFVPDPPRAVEAEPAPPPDGPSDLPASSAGAAPAKEPPPPPPINSFERYLEQRMPGWELGRPELLKEKDGYRRSEGPLIWTGKEASAVAGWCALYRGGTRTLAWVGVCSQRDFEKQSRIWSTIAERSELAEPEERSLDKIQRVYADVDLLDEAYRVDVRRKLVRGWKAEDTQNYIVVYDSKDPPLIRVVTNELEAMRREYERTFPPALPVTAVSSVRVCKDLAEYRQYGGPPSSGGYWNAGSKELVFYDYENVRGKAGTGKANSRIALYHEAFHQYIHYSCGELAPHSWFNEGTGDYFSGAVISNGKVNRIDVNPWRIGPIQDAIAARKTIPWHKLVRFEQPEYYAPDQVQLCYSQGWSMIYFLRTASEVDRRPEWKKILPVYFETLKAAWARELSTLQSKALLDQPKERYLSALRAREEAVVRAFEGVSFAEIEAAWARYTAGLRPPR